MGQKFEPVKEPAEQIVTEMRWATLWDYSVEKMNRIVLVVLHDESSIAEPRCGEATAPKELVDYLASIQRWADTPPNRERSGERMAKT